MEKKIAIKYLKDNEDKDGRIVIPFMYGSAIIHPSCDSLRRTTAISIVKELGLIPVPSYRDFRNHDIGATMYVFKSNSHKY